MYAKELEALNLLNLLHCSPVDGGVLGPSFPVVHNHLLYLAHIEGEVVFLVPHCQVSDLLPIGCLIVVVDQDYDCCVMSKLNDSVGVVLGHIVVGEQGIQEGSSDRPPC